MNQQVTGRDGPEARAKTRDDLAAFLSRSLGEAVARAQIAQAATRLALGHELTVTDALAILEELAATPGLVGVAARFAKARVHIAWVQP